MKTTIEFLDGLFRRAKVEAALRGRRLKDLVEEGLRLALELPETWPARPSLEMLMAPACGVMESGVSDLATKPDHMAGFGSDGRGDS
jgi:hypothetical protein